MTETNLRQEADEERRKLSYEGTAVPFAIVLLWLAFLIFGFFYFALHLI